MGLDTVELVIRREDSSRVVIDRTKVYILLIVCICFIIIGCNGEPDFSKPGSDGALPEGVTKGQRGMEYSGDPLLPSPLVCGTVYKISATARQQVAACENFDFTSLYNRANENAEERVKELRCPENCQPLYKWPILRKWDCLILGIDNPRLMAFASVQVGVLCPRETDEKPPGLGDPAPNSLKRPFQEPEGILQFQATNELIIEEAGDFIDVPCPGSDLISFTYAEEVGDCQGLNFKPVVDRAVERAQFFYSRLKCDGACTKQPFVVLKREWKCDPRQRVVEVIVYFQLMCKR